MLIRKTLLNLAYCLFFTPLFALNHQSNAPLWNHLVEVNVQWENQIQDRSPFLEMAQFDNEQERIRMHLLLVETILRDRTPRKMDPVAKAHRLSLLDALHDYALQGRFPKNHSLKDRTPFFIDVHGTACAVGHLLIESGENAFAEHIKDVQNNAYIREMNFPELPAWADAHGFSVDELAWIQPGYPFTEFWPSPISNGVNGPVTFMRSLGPNANLVVTGDFSVAGGTFVDNAFFLTPAGSVIPMGTGLEGQVHDVIEFDNNLWFGGEFTSGGGSNLAIFDPVFETWTFQQLFTGVIYDLEVFNGKLYAGGDLTHSGALLVQHIIERNQAGGWLSVGLGFDDPVHSLAVHNGMLYAGGEFQHSDTASIPYVGRWNGSNWEPVGTTNLGAPVRVLEEDNGYLYAGGDLGDTTLTYKRFGLARYATNDWDLLLDTMNTTVIIDPLVPGHSYIDNIQFSDTNIFVSGHFLLAQMITSFGTNVGRLGLYDRLFPELTPDSASTIHAMSIWNDKIVVGGNLSMINGNPAFNLAQRDISTEITKPAPDLKWTVYPNPVSDYLRVTLPTAGDWRGATLRLTGVDGRNLSLKYEVNGNTALVERSRLAKGVYLLSLERDGVRLATEALILD